jgi:ActR/RegA family two-component response regulator
MNQSPFVNRRPPNVHEQLTAAIINFDVNPYRLMWLYVWGAFEHHGDKVIVAAERLDTPRSTIQRIMHQKRR